jgi:TolA-binding protein
MNDNHHKIFSESECPGHERLLSYFHNQLTEEEHHRIEAHLIDCEMCSDELEGLSRMEHPEELDRLVGEIQSAVDSRVPRIVHMRYRFYALAAAAVLVVAVGTTVIIRLLTKTSPAIQTEAVMQPPVQPEKAVNPPPSTIAEAKKEEPGKTAAKPVSSAIQTPVARSSGAGVERMTARQVASDTEASPLAVREVPSGFPPAETQNAPSEASLAGKGVTSDKAVMEEESAKKGVGVSGTTTRDINVLMKQAMSLLNDKQYLQASGLFEKVLSEQPDNYRALYYSGVCYLHLQNFARARQVTGKLLSDPGNPYYNEAGKLADRIRAVEDSLQKKNGDTVR